MAKHRTPRAKARGNRGDVKDFVYSLGLISGWTFGDVIKDHFKKKGIKESELQEISERCKALGELIKKIKGES